MIKIGFIGCGSISYRHLNALKNISDVKIVSAIEPNFENFKKFEETYGEKLNLYKDEEEMIKKEKLDGVVICSPHTFHFEQIMYSLDAGLHVLTEKPMVCSIAHAKKVIEKSKKVGKVLMISYQRHFEPPFRYMREQIQNGAIGEVQFIQALLSQEWLKLTRNTWRQDPRLSCGGQLNDSGSHFIDIMMWMTGLKVKEVFAKIEFFDAKVDINSALTLVFENGALGNLSVVGNAPGWYEDHTIVGSKGALFLRQGLGVLHQNENGKYLKVRLPKANSNPNLNFVRSILGKEKPEVPPECGLRVIEVTESAWKSARLGKPVKVY